jgi:glycosyltransferase involved in cell wall biosynthesis
MRSFDPVKISLPHVTFIVLAYNQEDYILAAVESALAQNYSPLQIVIADDCSTDRTFETVMKLANSYNGPHEIVPLRHKRNLGLIGNLNKAMEIAKGELIVALGGDDIACPDRVQRIVTQWIENGKSSGSIFSNFKVMDAAGNARSIDSKKELSIVRLADKDIDTLNAVSTGTRGCAHAWTRDVFDLFGPIDPIAIHEDVTIPLRSLLIGSVTSMPDELVHYRVIGGTLSRASFGSYRERFCPPAPFLEALRIFC